MASLSLPIDLTRTRTAAVAGTAHLTFVRAGARTILERSYATSPVKLFATRAEPACWVYSATLGGGLVGGDDVRMTIDVANGALALLATQASTKVYRSLRPASQWISASIADDALLAVVPDPIVCYAEADFSQRQRYELEARGNLVVVDWITSGRHGSGERWAFARYESRIEITRGASRILHDGLVLEEAAGNIGERMGRFQVCLTAALTGPLVNDAAATLVTAASQLPIVRNCDLIESAVPLADGGALLRIAGVSVEQVAHRLREHLVFLLPLLGDDPWSRKW